MVIIDCSPSMKVRDKLEIQIGAAASLLYSAWQSETTYGMGVLTEQGIRSFGMGIGSRHFYYLYQKLWGVLTENLDRHLKGTRKLPLSQCLPPNAMMLYCSDFINSEGQLIDLQALKRISQRYDFVPVIVQDEFEYTFPVLEYGTFIAFSNPETGGRENVWMSPKEAKKIKLLHEERFGQLVTSIGIPGTRSVHLNNTDVTDSIKKIDGFFRRRGGRSG
jgi:uncharacterized protein (DUF58 family)